MKALSIKQPWATLIMLGYKTFETRSWPTTYRGPLYIHASKGDSDEGKKLWEVRDWREAVRPIPGISFESLPRGCVLGQVVVDDCFLMTDDFIKAQPQMEILFGNWVRGHFAFKLSAPMLWENPMPMKGQLGLFDVGMDIVNPVQENTTQTEIASFPKAVFRQNDRSSSLRKRIRMIEAARRSEKNTEKERIAYNEAMKPPPEPPRDPAIRVKRIFEL